METIDQAAQVAPSALVRLIQRREKAQTVGEFNALTVEIITELAKAKFVTLPDVPPDWVRLIAELLRSMERGEYRYPYKFDQEGGEDVLCIRTSHIMAHLGRGGWLRSCWADMGIRSDRALKKQLRLAGVLLVDSQGAAKPFERTLGGVRCGHLAAIRLAGLREAGLDPIAAARTTQKPGKP